MTEQDNNQNENQGPLITPSRDIVDAPGFMKALMKFQYGDEGESNQGFQELTEIIQGSKEDIIPRGTVYWRRRGVLDSGYFVLLEEIHNTDLFVLGIEFHLSMEAFGGLPGYEWETKDSLLYGKGERIHHNPNKSRRLKLFSSAWKLCPLLWSTHTPNSVNFSNVGSFISIGWSLLKLFLSTIMYKLSNS